MKNQKLEITADIPEGITVKATGMTVDVDGSGKKNTRTFNMKKIVLEVKDKKFVITAAREDKKNMRSAKTVLAHVKNMMKGLQTPFEYKLTVVSAHFPMNIQVKDKNVEVHNFLGQKEVRLARIMEGTEVKIKGKEIVVTGIDLEATGQTAANLESATRLIGRDSRVYQDGIYVTEVTK